MLRIRSMATSPLALASSLRFIWPMPCSAEIEPPKSQHGLVHGADDAVPVRHEVGLRPCRWAGRCCSARCRRRSGRAAAAARRGRAFSTAALARAMNSGILAIGTDTSFLMLPPSGFCASETPSRRRQKSLRLGERGGEAGIGDEALLGAGFQDFGQQPVGGAVGLERRRSPSARTRDALRRTDRACCGRCAAPSPARCAAGTRRR